MFKKKYEIKVAVNHYAVTKALMESMNLTVNYVKSGPTGLFIGFKAKEKQIDELIKKLYKYDIAKTVAIGA